MPAKKETILRTLTVAFLVSLVSSIFVAGAAIGLKPVQRENRMADMQRSILQIAGLVSEDDNRSGTAIKALFNARIKALVVDLKSGDYRHDIDPLNLDALKTARDTSTSIRLSDSQDKANIKRRENFATVYLVENNQGQMETIILPVRGYGLWSTLFGFLAIKNDLNTVVGLGFYQHGETPGLGGEVDNPRWKNLWQGKKLFNAKGGPEIHLVKGGAAAGAAGEHQVDALAGATLTSKGVDKLLNFWLGDQGFGPYLTQLRKEGA